MKLFNAFSSSLTWRDIQHLIARSSKPLNPPGGRSRRNPEWRVNNASLQGTDLSACKSRFLHSIFAGSKWNTPPNLLVDHLNSFALIGFFRHFQ